MNKVILCGRLVRDVDVKYTGDQKAIARFTLAINRQGKKNEADFVNCVAFGKTAESIEKYVKKGQQILVEGNIKTGNYEKDGKKVYTTDVWVERFEFVGSKADNEAAAKEAKADELPEGFKVEDSGDDLPF